MTKQLTEFLREMGRLGCECQGNWTCTDCATKAMHFPSLLRVVEAAMEAHYNDRHEAGERLGRCEFLERQDGMAAHEACPLELSLLTALEEK